MQSAFDLTECTHGFNLATIFVSLLSQTALIMLTGVLLLQRRVSCGTPTNLFLDSPNLATYCAQAETLQDCPFLKQSLRIYP